MTPKEIDIALAELEERVDRLRALYDQYFMGYEKLEPTVPRKEVERRFAILRKEQIRNTAQRFKFNVVTQKYNTYSMFWQRACRQIEEGTFKRHVQRAKQRFGVDAKRGREEPAIELSLDAFELDDAELQELLDEADRAGTKPLHRSTPPALVSPPVAAAPPPSSPQLHAAPGTAFLMAKRPVLRMTESTPGDAHLAAPGPARPPLTPYRPMAEDSRPALVPGAPSSAPRIVRRREDAPAPAAPSSAGLPPGAPSSGRIPAASPSGRLPAAPPPGGPSSTGRFPAVPPSAPASMGSAPGASVPSSARLPGAPPAAPSGRHPLAPPPGGARPMIRPIPGVRPSSPSLPDADRLASSTPERKSRPPLPSQVLDKKE